MLYNYFTSAQAHILTQKALARAGRRRQTGGRRPDTALQEVSKGLQEVVEEEEGCVCTSKASKLSLQSLQGVVVLVKQVN